MELLRTPLTLPHALDIYLWGIQEREVKWRRQLNFYVTKGKLPYCLFVY